MSADGRKAAITVGGMTMDQALEIAKNNPGQGVRDNANMTPKWKIVYIKFPRGDDGDFFCINPITGGDYQFIASEANKTSKFWRLI